MSDDRRSVTFKIRGATFHDGTEVSAADVVYSIEIMREIDDTFWSGPYEGVESVDAIGDRSVSIKLNAPTAESLVQLMAGELSLVIPEGSYEELRDGEAPIGTGPYRFSEWKPGSHVEISRFADYWGDAPNFATVTWQFFANSTASANAAQAGDVDVAYRMNEYELADVLDQTDGIAVENVGGAFYSAIWLNGAEPLFEDHRIRQAVAHAVDRQAIVDGAYAGRTDATCIPLDPPTGDAIPDLCPYEYDPARARELLEEAGVDDLRLELKILTGDQLSATIGDILISQMADVGITVETRAMEGGSWFADVFENKAYQLSLVTGAFISVEGIVGCPAVWTHDCVPDEVEATVNDAAVAPNPVTWSELRERAAEAHAEWAHWIPLTQTPILVVVPDDLVGISPLGTSGDEFDLRNLGWRD
ncbi:ABC transporter substrate-binding protein [Phytoactinopolyspora halotolerans]|uniref:ABC transporter substrate-binding protein n=1 Tax=Phytoactinopolyspora halotolerans TaxID=1981512 RepID=A0A6L9SHV6_9ACTN|nr:ABC transporter substrate-binding protein [Phytoactinopolyspora halotolerans]